MRVSNAKTQQFLQKYKKPSQEVTEDSGRKLPNDKVKISVKPREVFKISGNNPADPTVSTKVLDSLNMGMVNFTQEQRDTFAKVLASRAEAVASKNS